MLMNKFGKKNVIRIQKISRFFCNTTTVQFNNMTTGIK